VLEVETDLADDHDHLILGQRVHRRQVGFGRLERVVTDARPHLLIGMAERNSVAAAIEVDPDRDEARHSGRNGLLHDLGGIAQLVDMEMGVYEDGASSTTSSSRLKSGSGLGSLRPGRSSEGCQRSPDS